MKKLHIKICMMLAIVLPAFVAAVASDTTRLSRSKAPAIADNFSLKLQPGFSGITVVDSLGKNRHLLVSQNGDIYVKLARLHDGKGIVVLRENPGGGARIVSRSRR